MYVPMFSAAEVSEKKAPNWWANVSPLSLGTSLSPVRSHLFPTTHNAGERERGREGGTEGGKEVGREREH